MKLAYDQAMISESNGEVPVGAVYFDGNQVIAESGNVSLSLIHISEPTRPY